MVQFTYPAVTLDKTGLATSANQTTGNASLTSIDAKTPALGQQLAAASQPVVLTAAQLTTLTPLSSVAVNNFPATQAVSGTVAVSNFPASQAVTGAFFQATQPISAAALPLPTGAATETTLASLNSKVTAVNTGAVVVSSSVLPTSASTSALQTSGNASLTSIDTKTPALGQALAAASTPVVLTAAQLITLTPLAAVTANIGTTNGLALDASLTTLNASVNTLLKPANTLAAVTTVGTVSAVTAITNALPAGTNLIGSVKASGKTSANSPVRNDYASVSVTTAAFTQLVASLTSAATEIEIFDSSGQTLALAFGAAASETIQINIFPGGNGRIPLSIPAGTRVSIKAVSANATVGEININFYA